MSEKDTINTEISKSKEIISSGNKTSSEKFSNWYNSNKILFWVIVAIVIVVIIAVIVIAVKFAPKKEGFEQTKNNKIEINGHIIDCSPEIEYMEEFIKTSQELK